MSSLVVVPSAVFYDGKLTVLFDDMMVEFGPFVDSKTIVKREVVIPNAPSVVCLRNDAMVHHHVDQYGRPNEPEDGHHLSDKKSF